MALFPLCFALGACAPAAAPDSVEPRSPTGAAPGDAGARSEAAGPPPAPGPPVAEPAPSPASTAEAASTPDAPEDELEGIARAVLAAWRAKDLAALASYATAHNQEMIAALKPGSSRYESILGDESGRMKAVAAWDGRLHGCRYRGDRARCAFSEAAGEVMVLTFEREGDRWAFDDLHSPSRSDWEAWAGSPTPRGVKPSHVDCDDVGPGMPCTPDTPPASLEAP